MDETTEALWRRFLATTQHVTQEQKALLYEVFSRTKALLTEQENYIAELEAIAIPVVEKERLKRERRERFVEGVGRFLDAMGPVLEAYQRYYMEQQRQQTQPDG